MIIYIVINSVDEESKFSKYLKLFDDNYQDEEKEKEKKKRKKNKRKKKKKMKKK